MFTSGVTELLSQASWEHDDGDGSDDNGDGKDNDDDDADKDNYESSRVRRRVSMWCSSQLALEPN